MIIESEAVLARRELARRELARRDILSFIPRVFPDLDFNWYHRELADALNQFVLDVEQKKSPRLLISAPPRHSKSLFTTRGLTPWILGRHPNWESIVATSTQDLADYFGVEVRRICNDPEYHALFPDFEIDKSSNAVSHLATLKHGGYKLVGVGGGLPGRGAHVLICDDLLASREDAQSAKVMDGIWSWFNSVAMNRLSPGGGVIVMNTRWEIDDVIGRVMASDTKNKWKVLSYAALAEEDEKHRKKGEALHPERYTREMLEAERDRLTSVGKERDWVSLYQQRPMKESGGFFKAENLSFIPVKDYPNPKDLNWFIGTDFAASVKKTSDKTSLVPFGIDRKGDIYLAPDAVLERLDSLAAVHRLVDLIRKYRPMWVASEKGPLNSAYGPLLRSAMREKNVFATIREISRSQGKYVYATPVQARMQGRRLHFPDTQFYRLTVAPQFLNFVPGNDNQEDDFIDGLANGVFHLDQLPRAPGEPEKKELSPIEEEAATWKRIARNNAGRVVDKVPFRHLNGDTVTT